MTFLGQAELALDRDFEKLSVEKVYKPALRLAELGRDKGDDNTIIIIINIPQVH